MNRQMDLGKIGKEVLSREMSKNNKNARNIAQELGKQPSTISRWLKDDLNVSPDTESLNLIFNKYQITLDEVFMDYVPKEQAKIMAALARSDVDAFSNMAKILLSDDERIIRQTKEYLQTMSDYLEKQE